MDAAKKKNGHRDTSSDTAVSLKKGDFNTPPLIHFFKRKTAAWNTRFQNRRSAPQGRLQRSCFDTRAVAINRKEPINRVPVGYGLSALRLCVWLFDNCHIKLPNVDESFLFTLGAIKREIFKHCIWPEFYSCFILANRTQYPFITQAQSPQL